MAKKNSSHIRTSLDFKNYLMEIKMEKIKKGTAKRMVSDREITSAITRVPNLKDILVNRKFKKNGE